jgi:hypothetical protein
MWNDIYSATGRQAATVLQRGLSSSVSRQTPTRQRARCLQRLYSVARRHTAPRAENVPAASPESPEVFDWNDVDGFVLAEQAETAVYWNPKGDLVIRQRHWHDDDSLIFISKTNVDEFVDKLCDVVGIPSVGT